MGRPYTGAATFSVATVQSVIDRIDRNAAREGLSRSAYVLQWLPEAREDSSATAYTVAANGKRKSIALRDVLA